MPQVRRATAEEQSSNDLASMTQVSLWLGNDTLERLDAIVARGRFGGRGRALDALLDTLTDCVEDIDQWNLAWRHTVTPTVTDVATRLRFQDEMQAHAMRVWGRLERFFELAEWDSPPLPSESWPTRSRRVRSDKRRKQK
jgi:hypothetical protein